MRINLSIAMLITCFVQIANAGIAQRINLSERNQKLTVIFEQIRKQTDYDFVYPKSLLKEAKTVTVSVKEGSLQEVLAACFRDQPFTYVIEEKTVIVRARQELSDVMVWQATPPVSVIGVVTDDRKNPIQGATVSLKGSRLTTYTDKNGVYKINIPDNEKDPVLLFSFVGMKAQEIAYKGNNKIDIRLEEDVQSLNKVIITGVFNKSKDTYTGAARVISEQEIKQFQGRNIFVTLGNIDPAFYVMPNNAAGSDPNRVPDIQIRGSRNLPNVDQLQNYASGALNTPLVILDGFETTLQRLMDLDLNEVASITLLKDGNATSLYGSRGANGVVVIKTKEPEGGRLKLSYRGGVNVSLPDLSSYKVLNAKDKLDLERQSGFYSSATQNAAVNLELERFYNDVLKLVKQGVNTHWLSKPLRTQMDQLHNVKIEGGDNAFRYDLALQYNRQNGVMKGSDRKTVNGTINLSYRYKHLTFRNSTVIGQVNADQSPWGSFRDYVKLNPYWQPYDANGNVVRFFTPYNSTYWGTGVVYVKKPNSNPMYDATLNTYDKSSYSSIINNFQLQWDPLQGLFVRVGLGINATNRDRDNFKPANHSDFANYQEADLFRKGSYAFASGKDLSYTGILNAGYSRLLAGRHRVTANMNIDLTQNKTRDYSFLAEGFPDESIDYLGAALQYAKDGVPVATEATSRRIGGVAGFNYEFDSRYMAELNYRVDGSSQFGVNRRFAPFWSAGLGWNLHATSLVRNNLPFVNRMKLRATYGTTGSQQFNAYQSQAVYQYITNNRYKNWLGAQRQTLGNDNLEWQQTNKYDLGLEMDLFDRRVNIVADVYLEKTGNLLSSLELPYSNGFPTFIQNIGKLRQQGVELMASVMVIKKDRERIYLSVTGNMVYNKDEIVQLSEAMKAANAKLASQSFGTSPNKVIYEGASQNTIYVVRSLGIDPSTGKELFLSKTGEVTSTWNAADRVAAGVDQPKYRGNFSTLFRYKDLSFNASFSFRLGGQVYNQTLIDRVEKADKMYNVDERVYTQRWKQPGDVSYFKGINDWSPTYASSRFVQDESTLTCQNINIAYSLYNKPWMSGTGLTALTITANTGELFYISNFRQERGLDYPFSRQFSLSVYAAF
jgi:TonB-linked SusC/RagA family outer membrane protein